MARNIDEEDQQGRGGPARLMAALCWPRPPIRASVPKSVSCLQLPPKRPLQQRLKQVLGLTLGLGVVGT